MPPRLPLLHLACLSAALICGSVAQAAEPPEALRKAFGNTIVSTYPDGRMGDLWLQADGQYTAEGRHGDPSSGRWSVKDGKLCLGQSRPFPAPFHFCTPIPQGGLAHAWSAKAVTGESVSVRLVPGHYASHPAARSGTALASTDKDNDPAKSD